MNRPKSVTSLISFDASEFSALRTSYTTLNLLPADSFQQNLHESNVCGGILILSFSKDDVEDLKQDCMAYNRMTMPEELVR